MRSHGWQRAERAYPRRAMTKENGNEDRRTQGSSAACCSCSHRSSWVSNVRKVSAMCGTFGRGRTRGIRGSYSSYPGKYASLRQGSCALLRIASRGDRRGSTWTYPKSGLAADTKRESKSATDYSQGVRLGQNTLHHSRLVIDLERYDHHRIFTLPSPPRVVIDVYGDRSPRKSRFEWTTSRPVASRPNDRG